jgi:hypothetical protein
MTLTVVDSEQTIRTWARTEANISGAVATRVFFATPQPYEKVRPDNWIVMALVSEIHEPTDIGMQYALVQFTCWGKTKALAAATAIAVQQAGRQLEWGPPVTVGSAVIQTGSVSQRRWVPDNTTNLARYDVDLNLVIRGTATN